MSEGLKEGLLESLELATIDQCFDVFHPSTISGQDEAIEHYTVTTIVTTREGKSYFVQGKSHFPDGSHVGNNGWIRGIVSVRRRFYLYDTNSSHYDSYQITGIRICNLNLDAPHYDRKGNPIGFETLPRTTRKI